VIDVKFYRCARWGCQHVTEEPATRRIVDRQEFWGTSVPRISVEEICPACGHHDLRPAATCCDCLVLPAELGDERCKACNEAAEKAEHEAAMTAARQKRATAFVDFLKTLVIGERV